MFFHQNNQFEAETACFADFSILTKIAVSGPYRRGHFFGWFFEMLKIPFEFFWNIQNFVLSSKQSVWSKNSMFCGLFNFDQNRCIRTLPAWPFCWLIFWLIFQMLKIPFEFFWNIQNFVLSSKQSVWSKNSMFCGLFNFDENRCIRTLPAWAFCWLIFWLSFSIVENTLRILLKYSKFCSFIKTISLKQKQHVLMDFSILTKIAVSGPYRRGHFVGWFFWKCWKYPSNSSETFKILFFHQNNQFEAKTACFADFSILTKIAVSGPYRRGHFFGWFFEMLKIPFQFFWNIQNFVLSSKQSVWSKSSMFCGLFNFDQNRCIRTLPAWPFCWLIFFVEFFKCWKYPSNSSETFKILFFHQNNQFEAKTACFADFSILTKIAVSGPYRRGHFVSLFFWLIFLVDFFEMLKIPFQFFWNIQNFVLSSKQSVWSKNSMFCGIFNFDQNRCIPDLTGVAILLVDFLVEFFNCWKYPSNSSETFKILFFHQNNQFEAKTAFFPDFSILTKIAVSGPITGVAIFWLIFWNVENTLPILLKHSKFCSFIKTISLKQKQHVLWTFQFWRKSLYPDLTGVAILLVDLFRCFLKCWKYPSNCSETFKILFFHQNNQFEAKTACFADFSILTKIAVSGPYRRGNFVGWFFWLSFSNVENTLRILLKHSKFCSFIKTISLKQKQHVLWTFQFWRKSLYPDLTGVAILLADLFGWVFEMLKIPFQFFWNIQNFVLSSKQSVWSKNSMFCGLFNFHQNRCIRTLPAWPFCWLMFLVDFFGWFFEILKIPFEFFWNIQNFVLSSKQSVWSKNSMFCGLFNFDQNCCIRTLPAWPFCWLIFLVEFSKCWK